MRRWDKDAPEALAARNRFRPDRPDKSDKPDVSDPYGVAGATAEAAANTLICLINQAAYLLKRQLEKLEQSFLQEGGFTERLYQARHEMRRTGA